MLFGSILRNPVKLFLMVDKASYAPGESLTYKVRVDAAKDVDLKELKVELVGILKGKTTCWYRESEDGEEYSREADFSITLFSEEQVLISNTRIRKGSYVYSGGLDIPLDAPHSGTREMLGVEWYLRAKARRTLRSQQTERRVIISNNHILGPITAKRFRLGDKSATVLLPEHLRPGTAVGGILQLGIEGGSRSDHCNELMIEVINNVRIDKNTIDTNAENCNYINFTKTSDKKVIAKNITLAPQTKHEIPFEINIPEGAIPSFSTGISYSKWLLKITCKRGLMKKDEFSIPIKVT